MGRRGSELEYLAYGLPGDSLKDRPFRDAVAELQQRAYMLLTAPQAPKQAAPRTASRPASPARGGHSRPSSPGRGLDAAGQGSYLDAYLRRSQLLGSPKHGFYAPLVSPLTAAAAAAFAFALQGAGRGRQHAAAQPACCRSLRAALPGPPCAPPTGHPSHARRAG
jgi:hypothetical protein